MMNNALKTKKTIKFNHGNMIAMITAGLLLVSILNFGGGGCLPPEPLEVTCNTDNDCAEDEYCDGATVCQTGTDCVTDNQSGVCKPGPKPVADPLTVTSLVEASFSGNFTSEYGNLTFEVIRSPFSIIVKNGYTLLIENTADDLLIGGTSYVDVEAGDAAAVSQFAAFTTSSDGQSLRLLGQAIESKNIGEHELVQALLAVIGLIDTNSDVAGCGNKYRYWMYMHNGEIPPGCSDYGSFFVCGNCAFTF